MKVGAFKVMQHMSDTGDNELKLAPLGNIMEARLTKKGTKITIGIGDDRLVTKLALGEIVGGFIYCDKKHWEEVEARLTNSTGDGG